MRADADQLISGYDWEMEAPGCTPGASWWGVKILLRDDISEVFPFLNAELDRTNYHHYAKVLIWDKGDIRFALRPHEIAIAPVEDREMAQIVCNEIVDMICDTWSRRKEIEPSFVGKTPPPSMLQIVKLLPVTNCRECGCATCMAYAAALIKGQSELSQCGHISPDALSELSQILGHG